MVLLFVIAWPISKLLDFILGHGGAKIFRRAELRELVSMHGQDKKSSLSVDETTIIQGALDLKHKIVKALMTQLQDVFMLEINTVMDIATMKRVKESGHSRVPIYIKNRSNVKAILLVKSLLFVNLEPAPKISDLNLKEMPILYTDAEAYTVLNMFQTGKSHMAAVCDRETKETVGIVTLEDIIEELIQKEILDEEDNKFGKIIGVKK